MRKERERDVLLDGVFNFCVFNRSVDPFDDGLMDAGAIRFHESLEIVIILHSDHLLSL